MANACRGAPACDQPQTVFIDDKPLTKVPSKDALASNEVYIDYAGGRIYLADDPTNRKVEATIAKFAFESDAPDVVIRNITVEKYGSPAQRGAIHAREGARWTIENCVVRFNSGAGISVGTGTRVHACDIHHNGQIGIEGDGKDIVIDGNHIWSNNIYGFDPGWEGGGVKIAESEGVTSVAIMSMTMMVLAFGAISSVAMSSTKTISSRTISTPEFFRRFRSTR